MGLFRQHWVLHFKYNFFLFLSNLSWLIYPLPYLSFHHHHTLYSPKKSRYILAISQYVIRKGLFPGPVTGKISKKAAYHLSVVKENIKVGCRVRLKGQNEIGEVMELTEDDALIRFGNFLKLKAKINDLAIVL